MRPFAAASNAMAMARRRADLRGMEPSLWLDDRRQEEAHESRAPHANGPATQGTELDGRGRRMLMVFGTRANPSTRSACIPIAHRHGGRRLTRKWVPPQRDGSYAIIAEGPCARGDNHPPRSKHSISKFISRLEIMKTWVTPVYGA